jgi:methylglutaconyl-CoA hydratase
MSYQTLRVRERQVGVLEIQLNRPEIRNAFNAQVIDELGKVFSNEAMADSIRVVILSGDGKVFSAGGDLNWMKDSVEFSYEENLKDTRKLAHLFEQLNEFPKPLIGRIQGAAIGGGVGLVSICDVALAVESTVFSLSEVRLGIIPACIGPFVIAKIGPSHARRLFVSAERFQATQAREIGLIHEVLPTEQALDERLEEVIGNIVQCGPNAMQAAKKLVLDLSWPEKRAAMKDPLESIAAMLAELRVSEEGQEGVRAFLEKRKPAWLQK